MYVKGVGITAFGNGRYQFHPSRGTTVTVSDALRAHGVPTQGRRVAINGHPAGLDSDVEVGDELTVIPRVQGG